MLAYALLLPVLLKLGYAGKNQPIVGGGLVFLAAAVGVLYLAFVQDEMEAGPVLKVGGFALLALALLAFFWPMRPWPH